MNKQLRVPTNPASYKRTIGVNFAQWLRGHIVDQDGGIDDGVVADEIDRILAERGIRQ